MDSWDEFILRAERYLSVLLISTRLEWLMAAIAAALGAWWAGGPELFRVLGVMAPGLFALDLLTGMAAARLVRGEAITSARMGHSFVKLFVYLSLFLLSVALDLAARTDYAAQLALLVFVVAREAKSNLENLVALRPLSGVEIPGFIRDGFERLDRERENEHENRD